MPELPEVETVVTGLQDLLKGHRVQAVEHDWPKSFRITAREVKHSLIDACVIGLRRLGKMILIDLDNQYTLVIHLKMTGQLVYKRANNSEEVEGFGAGHPSSSLISKLPDKTTRALFRLDKQAILFFNDLRKFGWIKLLPTGLVEEADFISKLGPDALCISDKKFVQQFSGRNKSIKACLLDQTIIAGCGNIYADEALWRSGIHPAVPARRLAKGQLGQLRRNLQDILALSISKGGSSSRNYVNASGERGKYLDFVNVYQKAGQPCSKCANEIKRIIVAGRGTHICDICQKCNS